MKRLVYKVYDKFTFNQNKYLTKFIKLDDLLGDTLSEYQINKIKKCCKDHGIEIKSSNFINFVKYLF